MKIPTIKEVADFLKEATEGMLARAQDEVTYHLALTDRVAIAEMPSYIIPVAVNATTPEEYVAYHGPQGQEDIDNYLEWIKEEVKPLLKSNEHQICFMYEQGNVENPDSSFDSTPIFGKACDVIPMLIFAFRD